MFPQVIFDWRLPRRNPTHSDLVEVAKGTSWMILLFAIVPLLLLWALFTYYELPIREHANYFWTCGVFGVLMVAGYWYTWAIQFVLGPRVRITNRSIVVDLSGVGGSRVFQWDKISELALEDAEHGAAAMRAPVVAATCKFVYQPRPGQFQSRSFPISSEVDLVALRRFVAERRPTAIA
jgi:hypothetical protein